MTSWHIKVNSRVWLVNDRNCDGYRMQNENSKSMKLNTKIKSVIQYNLFHDSNSNMYQMWKYEMMWISDRTIVNKQVIYMMRCTRVLLVMMWYIKALIIFYNKEMHVYFVNVYCLSQVIFRDLWEYDSRKHIFVFVHRDRSFLGML